MVLSVLINIWNAPCLLALNANNASKTPGRPSSFQGLKVHNLQHMFTTFFRLGDGLKGTTKVALAQGQRFVALFTPIDAAINSNFDLISSKSRLIFPNLALFHYQNILEQKPVFIHVIWATQLRKMAPCFLKIYDRWLHRTNI